MLELTPQAGCGHEPGATHPPRTRSAVAGFVAIAGDAPVTPPRAERLIADVLGDPSLRLLLWSPEHGGYIDVNGSPTQLPSHLGDRGVTLVSRGGRPVAALVHDSGLNQRRGMSEDVAATALVMLENTRLKERIADAAQQERLRLERDLHDGVQQRLVAIQIKLSLAREMGNPDGALVEIEENATAALDELRALARGIYPPLLGERGLREALSSTAASAPRPVSVRCTGTTRYPAATEAAVYFSVSEAMQNAIKHAGAGAHLDLSVECTDAGVAFAVADTGIGFDPQLPSLGLGLGLGLVSMRNRMAAVGGTLTRDSQHRAAAPRSRAPRPLAARIGITRPR